MTNDEQYHYSATDEQNVAAEYAQYMSAAQQQDEAANVILHVNCSKESIERTAHHLAQQVHDGNINALELAVKMNALKKVMEQVSDSVRTEVISEVAKHGKSAEMYGSKIEVKEAGTNYDYTNCNDVVYNALQSEMNALKERMKQRETFLKTIQGSKTLVDENSGEVYTVYAPVKSSTTTYAITHK